MSKNTLDRTFEFVVTRENGLQRNSQDYSAYKSYINDNSSLQVCSFTSNSGNIMVIPIPVSGKNFSSISYFNDNASLDQQANFWQKVSIEFTKEINKNPQEKRWLCTEGLGVSYLHVRIDKTSSSLFFTDYKNPDYVPNPTPRAPKEKVLANLDKVCIDPTGALANAQLLKNRTFRDQQEYNDNIIENPDDPGNFFIINLGGEKLQLNVRGGVNETEAREGIIKRSIIDSIKQKHNDWEIQNENGVEIIKNKAGIKHWKTGFSQQEWKEIETTLKNSPNKEQELKKWYNPLDYPLPWTITLAFSALLIVITMNFWKRTKKRF